MPGRLVNDAGIPPGGETICWLSPAIGRFCHDMGAPPTPGYAGAVQVWRLRRSAPSPTSEVCGMTRLNGESTT